MLISLYLLCLWHQEWRKDLVVLSQDEGFVIEQVINHLPHLSYLVLAHIYLCILNFHHPELMMQGYTLALRLEC